MAAACDISGPPASMPVTLPVVPERSLPPVTAPAAGATQEDVFRYHLTMELQKLGSQPDKELIDRLVKVHYPSVVKCKHELGREPSTSEAQLPAPDTTQLATGGATGAVRSPEMLPWNADANMDENGVESSLLNLDFATDEPSSGLGGDVMELPGFPGSVASMRERAPEFHFGSDSVPAFVEDRHKSQERDDLESRQGVNPQLLETSLPPMADAPHTVKQEEDEQDAMSNDESFSIKNESTGTGHERTPSEPSATQSTFTAFTPMRLPSSLTPHSDKRQSTPSEADSLRPSLEEYKKLSSKEKRQLRNKISARNFRTRRKEYITLLEEQLADRDNVIESLRQQLSSMSMQNLQLKDEVRTLQNRSLGSVDVAKFIDALQRNTSAQGAVEPAQDAANASGPTLSRPASSNGLRPHSPRPAALQPNMRKDVSAPPRSNSPSAFWGGVNSLSPAAPPLVA